MLTFTNLNPYFHIQVGGIAVFMTWLLSFSVTKAFGPLSNAIGVYGCFWLFAGFSALSLVYVAVLLPETKGIFPAIKGIVWLKPPVRFKNFDSVLPNKKQTFTSTPPLPIRPGRTLEEIEYYFKEGHFPGRHTVRPVTNEVDRPI